MHDPTPGPYGDVCRRWTLLTRDQQDQQSLRLLGVPTGTVRLTEPEGADHYRTLVIAAVAGDPIAVAWLATSHRPMLLVRGRDLFGADPDEWGAVCLELLATTLARADLTAGRWLRRQVSRRLAERLGQRARRHLTIARTEEAVDPTSLASLTRRHGHRWAVDDGAGDAAAALHSAMARLDPVTRLALCALAEGTRTVADVAADHDLTPAALWQRTHRARRRLRRHLADFDRTAA